MDQRTAVLLALGAGVVAGTTGTLMVHPRPVAPPSGASAEATERSDLDDDESLAIANSNLVEGRRCRTATGGLPPPARSRSPRPPWPLHRRHPIDFGSRHKRLLTKEGWAHLAEQGVVPYRIPCFRDPPFTPSPEQLDHLGLAAGDGE